MTTPTFNIELYNALPSLMDADKAFVNSKQVLSALVPLFAPYSGKYGVCLLHRHCTLEDGEIMVATGNVSQPEKLGEQHEQCYPERWLATGEPYEFTYTRTDPPPPSLFVSFEKAIRDMPGVSPTTLGIFAVQVDDHLDEGGIYVERTEGRKSIVEWEKEFSEDLRDKVKETGWAVREDTNGLEAVAAMMACITCWGILCWHIHI
jgi:hypothetical protein